MASSYGTDADKSSLRSNYLRVRRTIPARLRISSDDAIRSTLRSFGVFAAPQFSTLLDMAHGCSSISAGLAQKAYEIYPYVELLEDGDWFDKIEELTQGGIEVS